MDHVDRDLCWLLLYTKARAESWAEINLRKQGFATLLPRVRQGDRYGPLFPRYVFVGAPAGSDFPSARSTRGVLYVVQWNKTPASAAQSAIEILQSCGANVTGAILSKVNVKKQARYGYGDASDYFHYSRHYYITNA